MSFSVKESDLKIDENFNSEEGTLTILVPYPENYPETDFKKFCVENDISMTEFFIGCIEKVLKEQSDKSSER